MSLEKSAYTSIDCQQVKAPSLTSQTLLYTAKPSFTMEVFVSILLKSILYEVYQVITLYVVLKYVIIELRMIR